MMSSRQATPYTKYSTATPLILSYSSMPNIKQTTDAHNKTKLSQTASTSEESTCTCRIKEECPMSKKFLVQSIVYIKLQFHPTTTVHLKHMLVLLKTILKLDFTTTKHHLICRRKRTPQNSLNMSGS